MDQKNKQHREVRGQLLEVFESLSAGTTLFPKKCLSKLFRDLTTVMW